jgi:hypothetical protein
MKNHLCAYVKPECDVLGGKILYHLILMCYYQLICILFSVTKTVYLCDIFSGTCAKLVVYFTIFTILITGVTFLQMGPGFPVTIPSLSVAADHYNSKAQVS